MKKKETDESYKDSFVCACSAQKSQNFYKKVLLFSEKYDILL